MVSAHSCALCWFLGSLRARSLRAFGLPLALQHVQETHGQKRQMDASELDSLQDSFQDRCPGEGRGATVREEGSVGQARPIQTKLSTGPVGSLSKWQNAAFTMADLSLSRVNLFLIPFTPWPPWGLPSWLAPYALCCPQAQGNLNPHPVPRPLSKVSLKTFLTLLGQALMLLFFEVLQQCLTKTSITYNNDVSLSWRGWPGAWH